MCLTDVGTQLLVTGLLLTVARGDCADRHVTNEAAVVAAMNDNTKTPKKSCSRLTAAIALLAEIGPAAARFDPPRTLDGLLQ